MPECQGEKRGIEIDPEFITTADWTALGAYQITLWIIAGFAVVIALEFLIAHALIPSFVETGHIPRQLGRLRPLFYAGSAGALVGLVAFIIYRLDQIQIVYEIYARVWI